MIRYFSHEHRFINECLNILSIQYSQNRQKLRKLLNNNLPEMYDIPDASIIYSYKPSDAKEINLLVRQQIKLNKLMMTGKEMLNKECNCHK